MDKKIGFIGCGNMGKAMIGGMLSSGLVSEDQVMASCRSEASAEKTAAKLGIAMTTENRKVAEFADVLFLAVKPNTFGEVIPQIRDAVKETTVVVSVAAGQPITAIEELFQRTDVKLVRTMPNTPALVGEAMSALCANSLVTEEEMSLVKQIFESFGKAETVSESLMDAVVGVSGSSPAYVYMFIEAMADAAVADGMPRAQAYKFAAQSVKGAAEMVLATGKHPGQLKDDVCSPGGTTIEAVNTLENLGFRRAVIAGQRDCVKKSREMSSRKA